MATPRVSSRLATKKKSNTSRRNQYDDFEYSPLAATMKSDCRSDSESETETPRTKNNLQKPESKSIIKADRPKMPVASVTKRKRGRTPKVVSNDQNSAKTRLKSQKVECVQDKKLQREVKEGLETLLESQPMPSDVHPSGQIFSVVAALLPTKLVESIPGSIMDTMDTVAMENGIHWENHKQEAMILYGSLSNLNKANSWLEKVISENQQHTRHLMNKNSNKEPPRTLEASVTSTLDNTIEDTPQMQPSSPIVTDPKSIEMNNDGHIPVPTCTGESDLRETNEEAGPSSVMQGSSVVGVGTVEEMNRPAMATDEADITVQLAFQGPKVDGEMPLKDEISSAEEKLEVEPDKSRMRRHLRQMLCQHQSTDCEICQSYCDQCSYRSTVVGLRKHKQRVHPTVTFACELCDMTFGIRYDMRRHRLIHFDHKGNLTRQAEKVIEKSDKHLATKMDLLGKKLCDYENMFHCSVAGDERVGGTNPSVTDVLRQPPAKCGFCDLQGTPSTLADHHTSVHRVISEATVLHQCSECGEGSFSSEEDLSKHCTDYCVCAEKSGNGRQAKCLLCEMVFEPASIRDHLQNHPMVLDCIQCQHKAETSDDMESHLVEKHGWSRPPDVSTADGDLKVKEPKRPKYPPKETSVLYKCGICERIFKTRASLHVHFKTHEDKKLHPCSLCDFVTDKLGVFNFHQASKHSLIDKRQCDICFKIFAMPSTLKFHQESVHGVGQKMHVCEICQKQFTARRFLQVHIKRTHAKVQRFFCPVCAKGFFDKVRMVQHHETHLPPAEQTRKFVCSFCGKGFRQKNMLRQHENIHQGLKPYKCTMCDKAFCYASELNKHYIAHNNARPHICSYCGKGFKFRYKLTAHMTTHTRQGQFACLDCNKVYTARATLRKHVCKARIMDDVMALKQQAELKAKFHGAAHDPSRIFLMDSEVVTTTTSSDKTVYLHSVKQETAESVLGILGGVNGSHVVEVLANEPDIDDEVSTIIQASKVKLEDSQENVDGSQAMALDVHEQLSTGGPGVLYMCSICNNLFQHQADVNAHMNLEHGAEAIIGQEEQDGMEVPSGSILVHDGLETGAEFLVQEDLTIHCEEAI